MNIKFAEHSRVASYRIALGVLLYTVWRGVVRFFSPTDFNPHRLRGRHWPV